jgi:signal transduction histidine kinase
MLVRAPGLLIRGEVIRRKYLPVVGENERGEWNVGWAESLIKNELDGEAKQNRIVAFVPNEKTRERIAIIQTAQNQSGDIGAGIAIAVRKRKYKRDPLLFQALALGVDMVVQRIGSILMEVVHRREGLGVENLGLVMRILAHELNNELQGALNNMDTYEDLWAEKSELSVRSLRSLLTRAGYWTSLMREAPFLVDDVLPFERNIVCMNDEIRNVLGEVKAAWPDVMFQVEMDDNVNVVGDQHVRSILRNLLHNAASYTPMEGKVEVRVNIEYDKVHIYVEDEGPGVDPADVDKIFAPLESIKEGRKAGARADYGMGVGLTLSRAIARAYGGELNCHSNRKMEGGLFEVILPLAEETTENE